ncbi:MAG: hypothetical protein PHU46_10245 [Rhodocyclaceae bacterium]|nr:hypothetical protein [Rhodocyclaceae bacterium]
MSSHPVESTDIGRPVWHQDQAAGLRRLFKARHNMTLAFVSAMPGTGTTRLAARLGLALASRQDAVLLVDEHGGAHNLSAALGAPCRFDLAQALDGGIALDQVLVAPGENLRLLLAAKAVRRLAEDEVEGRRQLAACLAGTWRRQSFVLADARVEEGGHPLSVLSRAASHVVLVVGAGTAAVTSTYLLVKRLVAAMPGARLLVLVSRARGEQEARGIFSNLAGVARQHLGVELGWMGWVPPDPGWRDGLASSMAAGVADRACESLALALRQMAGVGDAGDRPKELHGAAESRLPVGSSRMRTASRGIAA